MARNASKVTCPRKSSAHHFSKFYTDEDRQTGEPQKALQTVEREGRFEKEGWRVRKDGTRFWAHVVIDAIRDDHGKLIGYAKITRDITERKNAQQQLEAAREALLQSQKMEAIGQLTGGVAHDFNNLLMAVLGSLELMRKRLPDDPKLMALLDNAVQGAQRGTMLTKRMLAFARRQELKKEAVDIPELVRGMTDLLQRSLGPSILIETHFPLVSKAVLADANQLEMILLNLTVNARDAMPDGGRIVIATREEVLRAGDGSRLKPGAYICLTVQRYRHREWMRRRCGARWSLSSPPRDSAKARDLASPWCTASRSNPADGLHCEAEKAKARPPSFGCPLQRDRLSRLAEAERPAGDAAADQRSLVVLAVDDDALVLTNTVAMLDDLGHTGIAASSGKEALDILRQQGSVDLVITDYAMPQMTGLQLADAIKKEWPELPVIIATGFAEMEPETESSLPKLAKPFTEAELAKELERIVPRARIGGRVLKFQTGAGSKS